MKKSDLEPWLRFLRGQPLYKHYYITADWSVFQDSDQNPCEDSTDDIEAMDSAAVTGSEIIHSLQHTMLWNEEHCLDIAPGQNRRPESLLFDQFAEELSFPGITSGSPVKYDQRVRKHPAQHHIHTWCMSEIHRRDQCGATPQYILYQAMKILRFRVRDGVQNMYKCVRSMGVTCEQIGDRSNASYGVSRTQLSIGRPARRMFSQ